MVTQETYEYTVVFYHTYTHQIHIKGMDDEKDSKLYYHFTEFQFPPDMPLGEYRYFVLPYTTGTTEVENNLVYVDGVQIKPEATGLLQYGDYDTPLTQDENNKTIEFIEYEG